MIWRGLFIADGASDLPLARHLETLCRFAGATVEVVELPSDLLPAGVGRKVEDRLRAVLAADAEFDIVFVHRDSESNDPSPRYKEVAEAAAATFDGPAIAVVPVRMTEAWLLLDEKAIRLVAGSPSGTAALDLPSRKAVEKIADPKRALQDALTAASGLQGRKLKIFRNQFPVHRALLLERLDPTGVVSTLAAWRRLADDIARSVPI